MKTNLAVAAIVALIAAMPLAMAQETAAEDLLGTQAGDTPDSWTYGFKRFFENVQLWLTFDNLEKAKVKYRFAQLRLAEAGKLVEKNRTELAQQLMREYETELNDTNSISETALAQGRNITALVDIMNENAYRHMLVLQKVYGKVPESAKPALEKVMEISLERHREAVARIEGRELVNITLTVGNETITRTVPAKLVDKFLEKADEIKRKHKEEIEINDSEDLQEKVAEKLGLVKERVREFIDDVKEDLAEIESVETNVTALQKIIEEAQTHISQAETAFSEDKLREAYHHAVLAKKAVNVADRLLHRAENIEKVIAEKLEIRQEKAQEQIDDAKEAIVEAEEEIAGKNFTAIEKLLNVARTHLSKAEEAFGGEKYGEAFGQAVAAEHIAKSSVKLAEVREKVRERIEEIRSRGNLTIEGTVSIGSQE